MIEKTKSYKEDKPYTIQQMATLTGVKSVTLRAWERRYGLLDPTRSGGRYRMYGQSDVDKIIRVTTLINKGISIKQAAELVQHEELSEASEAISHWSIYIDAMAVAISRLDEQALEDAYHRALSQYPMSKVLRNVIVPLLEGLGERWASGEGTVTEEHFFSVYLRNQLGAQFHHLRPPQGAKRILAACLPGEMHENGLLIFALAAQVHGYHVTVLGANMPLEELARAAKQIDASAIVLSGMRSIYLDESIKGIKDLIYKSGVPVLIGGAISTHHIDAIVASGAKTLGQNIDHALKQIDELFSSDV